MDEELQKSEIAALREAFDRSATEIAEFLAPLDEERIHARITPKKWTVGECIAHLNRLGNYMADSMERSIRNAPDRLKGVRKRRRYGLLNRIFIRSMDPSSSMKVPTPKLYRPEIATDESIEELLHTYKTLQERFLQLLEASEGLDLKRVKVRSPALPLLRFSLGACFHAMEAHQRRHLEQARRTNSLIDQS